MYNLLINKATKLSLSENKLLLADQYTICARDVFIFKKSLSRDIKSYDSILRNNKKHEKIEYDIKNNLIEIFDLFRKFINSSRDKYDRLASIVFQYSCTSKSNKSNQESNMDNVKLLINSSFDQIENMIFEYGFLKDLLDAIEYIKNFRYWQQDRKICDLNEIEYEKFSWHGWREVRKGQYVEILEIIRLLEHRKDKLCKLWNELKLNPKKSLSLYQFSKEFQLVICNINYIANLESIDT